MHQKWITSLLKPTAYPEKTYSVTLLQTHVSFIFLTEQYVYKVKKPVNLGFLDFTTIDRRRFYCEEEVRLNRRLCPQMYLGVSEIRENASGIVIDGDGRIIDYAVKMRRLPEDRMLSRLLKIDAVSSEDIRQVAVTIAQFHAGAAQSERISQYGTIENITFNWDENYNQLKAFVNVSISNEMLLLITSWGRAFIAENRAMLLKRISDGYIRECDGDLHTENICMTDTVCIFDCIEFNERFRCSDTAADIAFLLMDLDFHAHRFLAQLLLDEYRKESHDDLPELLLEFYKVYRAVVRGKVASFKLNDPTIEPDEKETYRREAERYLRLARGYILARKLKPTLLITCGLMGSGKTAFAHELSFELGINTLVADKIRKQLAGSGNSEKSAYGEGIYTPAHDGATYNELRLRCREVLQAGKSVIADATFRRKSDRASFLKLAREIGAAFLIISTVCPDETIKSRLDKRERAGNSLSDGRWELFNSQKRDFEALEAYEGHTIVVDTSLPLLDNVDRFYREMGLM